MTRIPNVERKAWADDWNAAKAAGWVIEQVPGGAYCILDHRGGIIIEGHERAAAAIIEAVHVWRSRTQYQCPGEP